MRNLFPAMLSMIFFSCNGPQKKPTDPFLQPETNYQHLKKSITEKRTAFSEQYSTLTDTLKTQQRGVMAAYLTTMIGDSLFSYWKGTKYEVGRLQVEPGEGPISHRRFITRILKDIDADIREDSIADATAEQTNKRLFPDQLMQDKTALKQEVFNTWLTQQGKGVYLIDLGIHQAFIINDGNQNWIIDWEYPQGLSKKTILGSGNIKDALYKKVISVTGSKYFIESVWLGHDQ